jgi:ParB-like chromosome segregation protein Spo0J
VLTVIEAWEKGKKEQDKEFKKGQEQLVQIMKRHDAKREEADRVAAKLDESIRDLDRSFLEMRFRAKDQLTKEEWDAARKHFNK